MKIALPFPRSRREAPDQPPVARGRRPRLIRIALLLAGLGALLIGGLWLWRARAGAATGTTSLPVPVSQSDLVVTIESSGAVKPASSVSLPFQTSGQVREVLVKPGDQVAAGQPLARLDDHDLRLEVQQAEADLRTAQARLSQAQSGSPTSQDLVQAQASLQSAEAQLQKTRTGNVTAADITGATAQLRAAQARLAALKNPSPANVSAAQLAVTQAQITLQKTRDSDSAAKTRAEQDMQRAAAALTQAQSSYSTALQKWQYVKDTGNDPVTPATTNSTGHAVANTLNDAQRQQYYDAFVQAQAAMHSAEQGLTQAQVAYENARQQEVADVQQAEAQLANAQQQLAALLHPSATDLSQGQAAVDQAQASLQKLRQGGTPADIAQAQAQVDQARAGLDKLTAPAAESNIAIAQAAVDQAQAKLGGAKLKLEGATLAAPFAGTVATVNVVPGGIAGASTAAVALVDASRLHIDLNVSETDVAQIKLGQAASITFDALPGQTLTGTVTLVAPTASEGQSVVTYLVQVAFDPGKTAVKVGMSATASIEVERHAQVLQVPNRAITSAGSAKTVEVLYGKEQTPVTVRVQTGATNGTTTEIVSCLDTGKQCLHAGDLVRMNIPSATSSSGPGAGDRTFFQAAPAGGPGAAPRQIIIGP